MAAGDLIHPIVTDGIGADHVIFLVGKHDIRLIIQHSSPPWFLGIDLWIRGVHSWLGLLVEWLEANVPTRHPDILS